MMRCVVQLLGHVRLFAIPWTAALQASLSFTISQSLLKLMSIHSVMPSNHFILSPPFSCLQSSPAPGSFPMSRFFASGSQSIGARQWVNVFVLFLTKDDISLFFAENTEDQRPKSFHHILNENWPLPKLCIYQLPNCLPPFPTYSPCPSSTFC